MRPIADYADAATRLFLWHSGLRGLANRRTYGPDAPRPGQQLLIDPQLLNERYFEAGNAGVRFGARYSGTVVGGDWDTHRREVVKSIKFRSCKARFIEGTEWQATQVFKRGLKKIDDTGDFNGCRSEEQLINRYRDLDALWAQTTATNTLAATKARRLDQILVHVARDGQPLFGNQGFHRLSIAQLANVPEITVLLGIVHPDAIGTQFTALLAR